MARLASQGRADGFLMVRVAISGTPGSGKTTMCLLLQDMGKQVRSVSSLAKMYDCMAGYDDIDEAEVIDMDLLSTMALPDEIFIDGHLSHMLPVDEIWVLRADPRDVRSRLNQRGYAESKIQENWEAECLDLILQESMGQGVRVVQRDGSRRRPSELLNSFLDAGPAPSKNHDIEPVDWSERLLG